MGIWAECTWYIEGNPKTLFAKLKPEVLAELEIHEIRFRDCYLEVNYSIGCGTNVREFEEYWTDTPSGIVEKVYGLADDPFTYRQIWIAGLLERSECRELFDRRHWTNLEASYPEHKQFFKSRASYNKASHQDWEAMALFKRLPAKAQRWLAIVRAWERGHNERMYGEAANWEPECLEDLQGSEAASMPDDTFSDERDDGRSCPER